MTGDTILFRGLDRKFPISTKNQSAKHVRILLLIPHLGGGGAEQVTALLARGLSREKYELHLGLITQSCADAAAFPPWVTIHSLGATRVRGGAVRLVRLVRRLRPDVILSGMAHLNFLVLLLRPAGLKRLIEETYEPGMGDCRATRAFFTGCCIATPIA